MKALILYRSFYGNTKQVADVMAQQVNAEGHESIVQDLRQRLPDPEKIDFVLMGSPTRMKGVNRKALSVLRKLGKKGFIGKPIAVFDTYGPIPTKPEELEKGKGWLYPGAAGIMERVAKEVGLRLYPKSLRCEVAGIRGPLKENEAQKATAFAQEFVASINKG